MKETTLIVGGTGKTGRRIAARLAAQGALTRIASRSAATPFDWDRPGTWEAALEGMNAVYLAYHPDLAVPGAAENIAAFVARARSAGVKRIVLLSGRGEAGVLPSERVVRESGLAWTILRCSWFAQNFSESFLLDPVRAGEIAFPAGDVAEPFVDLEDVADVAVAALGLPGHDEQIYELTGGRLLTFADAAREISEASGRVVSYRPISTEAFALELARHLPEPMLSFTSQLFAEVLDGHNAHVANDIERVLGRPPRDFRAYARDAASSGVWL